MMIRFLVKKVYKLQNQQLKIYNQKEDQNQMIFHKNHY